LTATASSEYGRRSEKVEALLVTSKKRRSSRVGILIRIKSYLSLGNQRSSEYRKGSLMVRVAIYIISSWEVLFGSQGIRRK